MQKIFFFPFSLLLFYLFLFPFIFPLFFFFWFASGCPYSKLFFSSSWQVEALSRFLFLSFFSCSRLHLSLSLLIFFLMDSDRHLYWLPPFFSLLCSFFFLLLLNRHFPPFPKWSSFSFFFYFFFSFLFPTSFSYSWL